MGDAELQAEWARAARAGAARRRRQLIAAAVSVAGIGLAIVGFWGGFWWLENHGKGAQGAECTDRGCRQGLTCISDRCRDPCRSGAICDEGETCIDVELVAYDPNDLLLPGRQRAFGSRLYCYPSAEAAAILKAQRK